MTASPQISQKRVRASERALRVAFKAMKDSGLSVDKLLINGGQIEIHCAGIERAGADHENEGLEKW